MTKNKNQADQQIKDHNTLKLFEYLNDLQDVSITDFEAYLKLTKAIKELTDNLQNVNLKFRDISGNTIFHHEIFLKDPLLMEKIIKADPEAATIKNDKNQLPSDTARKYRSDSTSKLVQNKFDKIIDLLEKCENEMSVQTSSANSEYSNDPIPLEELNANRVTTISAHNSNKRKFQELDNKENTNSDAKRPKNQHTTEINSTIKAAQSELIKKLHNAINIIENDELLVQSNIISEIISFNGLYGNKNLNLNIKLDNGYLLLDIAEQKKYKNLSTILYTYGANKSTPEELQTITENVAMALKKLAEEIEEEAAVEEASGQLPTISPGIIVLHNSPLTDSNTIGDYDQNMDIDHIDNTNTIYNISTVRSYNSSANTTIDLTNDEYPNDVPLIVNNNYPTIPSHSTNNINNNINSFLPIIQNYKDSGIKKLGEELIAIIDQKITHQITGKVPKTVGNTIGKFVNTFLENIKQEFVNDNESLLKILNYQDKNGNTALHISVFKNFITIAKTLIKMGANPAIQNKQGDTVGHLAAEWGEKTKLIKLTENKCIDIKNLKGKSVKDIIPSHKKPQGVKTTDKKDYIFKEYEQRFPNDDNNSFKHDNIALDQIGNSQNSDTIQKVIIFEDGNINSFFIEVDNSHLNNLNQESSNLGGEIIEQ